MASTQTIKAVLCDIGGVLHVGSTPIPGVPEALAKLRACCTRASIPIRFITNTDTLSRRMLIARLRDEFRFGSQAPSEDEVFTAPLAAKSLIERESLQPLLLIHPDAAEDYQLLPNPNRPTEVNAVVVADVGKQWSIDKLNEALRILLKRTNDGKPTAKLIGMSRTRYYADDDGLVLDSGSFVKMLEYAAGVEATIVGKPDPTFFNSVLDSIQCSPSSAVMIGDDIETDIGAAQRLGIQGMLVKTGKYRPGDETRTEVRPNHVFSDFPAAVDWICSQL
eukprot:TRINITY_DN9652_c0_g1_i1.p1 TRINITY_DN9652_c0_g1~~TRINITY_DN9652_c0_g1_i1.p1  ORF type:complete len:278 (+),score=43.23 TRINITY_DN9652_c0_g1_i1:52-885(+)